MTKEGGIPTQTCGLGQVWGILEGSYGSVWEGQQFKTHSNTDTDPTKGSDSTETAG